MLGKNHPDYASSLNNIGLTYHNKGDYDKSLSCYFQSLEIMKNILG